MNVRLEDVFAGAVPSGVYRYHGRESPDAMADAAASSDWAFFYLDGRDIGDKASFIAAVGAAARFPAYSAANWDALEESLRDLSWAAGSGHLILWEDARVMARSSPAEFATAVGVLRACAEFWERRGTPMIVLLRRTGLGTAMLLAD